MMLEQFINLVVNSNTAPHHWRSNYKQLLNGMVPKFVVLRTVHIREIINDLTLFTS